MKAAAKRFQCAFCLLGRNLTHHLNYYNVDETVERIGLCSPACIEGWKTTKVQKYRCYACNEVHSAQASRLHTSIVNGFVVSRLLCSDTCLDHMRDVIPLAVTCEHCRNPVPAHGAKFQCHYKRLDGKLTGFSYCSATCKKHCLEEPSKFLPDKFTCIDCDIECSPTAHILGTLTFENLITMSAFACSLQCFAKYKHSMEACLQSEKFKCGFCRSSEGILNCSKCKNSFYCSAACQKSDWPRHKLICVKAEPIDPKQWRNTTTGEQFHEDDLTPIEILGVKDWSLFKCDACPKKATIGHRFNRVTGHPELRMWCSESCRDLENRGVNAGDSLMCEICYSVYECTNTTRFTRGEFNLFQYICSVECHKIINERFMAAFQKMGVEIL